MDAKTMLQSMIEYHIAAIRKTWDVIDSMVEEREFLQEFGFSWDSIRNEMVHVASVDRRWLAGLMEQDVPAHVEFETLADRASARIFAESVLQSLHDYCSTLTEAEIGKTPGKLPGSRWQILLHIVNHGTDHRARVLAMLERLGKPQFDQDYIYFLLGKL